MCLQCFNPVSQTRLAEELQAATTMQYVSARMVRINHN